VTIRVSVVMDLPPGEAHHSATVAAVGHAGTSLGFDVAVEVVPTETIGTGIMPDAVVIGPGSPYQRPEAVLEVIRLARERGIPLVGT
jgi:CTP synthase (UTP-ammonia lyase)